MEFSFFAFFKAKKAYCLSSFCFFARTVCKIFSLHSIFNIDFSCLFKAENPILLYYLALFSTILQIWEKCAK